MDNEQLHKRFLCDAHFEESSFMNKTKHRLVSTAVPVKHNVTEVVTASTSTDMLSADASVHPFPPSSPPLKVRTPKKTYSTTFHTLREKVLPVTPENDKHTSPPFTIKHIVEMPQRQVKRKLFMSSNDDTPRKKKLKVTIEKKKNNF